MIFEFNMMDMRYEAIYDVIYDMVCDMVYAMMYDKTIRYITCFNLWKIKIKFENKNRQ